MNILATLATRCQYRGNPPPQTAVASWKTQGLMKASASGCSNILRNVWFAAFQMGNDTITLVNWNSFCFGTRGNSRVYNWSILAWSAVGWRGSSVKWGGSQLLGSVLANVRTASCRTSKGTDFVCESATVGCCDELLFLGRASVYRRNDWRVCVFVGCVPCSNCRDPWSKLSCKRMQDLGII